MHLQKNTQTDNVMKILEEMNDNILFHCVLENQHAIAMTKNWIFDPIFTKAVEKTEKNFRLCAESLEHETTNSALRFVYLYDFTNNLK